MTKNTLFILGMFGSICVGVAGAAKDLGHPWDHVLVLAGLAGTAINGFLAQRPREEWTEEKREEKRTEQDLERLTKAQEDEY